MSQMTNVFFFYTNLGYEYKSRENDENIFPCLWNTDIQKTRLHEDTINLGTAGKASKVFFFFWSVCTVHFHWVLFVHTWAVFV